MDDQHRQELLRSSAAYATAKLSFANAIVIAQRAGETDEEIAHRERQRRSDQHPQAKFPTSLNRGVSSYPGRNRTVITDFDPAQRPSIPQTGDSHRNSRG